MDELLNLDLDEVDIEVLNAVSDDWESLDQIFLSIRFDVVSAKADERTMVVQRRKEWILLSGISESLQRLARAGLVDVRNEIGLMRTQIESQDLLTSWFRATAIGIKRLQAIARTGQT